MEHPNRAKRKRDEMTKEPLPKPIYESTIKDIKISTNGPHCTISMELTETNEPEERDENE